MDGYDQTFEKGGAYGRARGKEITCMVKYERLPIFC